MIWITRAAANAAAAMERACPGRVRMNDEWDNWGINCSSDAAPNVVQQFGRAWTRYRVEHLRYSIDLFNARDNLVEVFGASLILRALR